MLTDRYFSKSSQQSRTVLVGLVFCTTLGLQSCNFLQTQKNSESDKPSVKANPAQGGSDPLSKPLPTSQQGQIPNLGQPISGGTNPAGANNKVKIDPITGLPVIADSPDASNPATSAMDPSLKNPVTSTTGGTATNNPPLNPNTARALSKPLLKSTAPKPIAAKSPTPAKGATTQAGVTPLKSSINEPFSNALPGLQAAPPPDAAAVNPGGPVPSSPSGSSPSGSSPPRSSFGSNPSGFSSGTSSSDSSGTGGSSAPANGAASTSTSSNSTGFGGTSATSNSGTTPSAPANSGSGYVYDPSTAAYRPANSLPVWSPGSNASNSTNPTQPPASP
jgi:hypothetical protein